MSLDGFKQYQIVLKQFAANSSQLWVRQERLVSLGNDPTCCSRSQAAILGMERLHQEMQALRQ